MEFRRVLFRSAVVDPRKQPAHATRAGNARQRGLQDLSHLRQNTGVSTTSGLTALVLAGSRGPHKPLAIYAGVSHKALIEIDGLTMVERVVIDRKSTRLNSSH